MDNKHDRMNFMAGNIVHDASLIGSGATITSGMLLWFGENATAVGAIITVMVGLLTILFQLLNYRLNRERLEFDRRKVERKESEA